ncbi:EsV-1-199 [Ectocarpus siliculosus]|uniref:EsV-1-199 n=1 Tax=Ectocarpus siliculosus TaxID=2880 RepID=D7G318_ECTSI|nr:EsV-1-199 [Ectocarpus siliculosus]|eukprot:CBJ33461.1 EsV-1-199 [Ectocarpus siliculosus]
MPRRYLNLLHRACHAKDYDRAVLLVEAGTCDVNSATPGGFSPLMIAALTHQGRLARYLLSKGGSVSQKAINGRTALMVAADGGYLDITTLLVDAGAAVDTADTDGKKTALHLAVEGKHPEVVRFLLEANANPSARVRDGRTPLHAACWIGDVRTIDLLVSAGSDPQASTKGTNKMVPLDFAAESGQREAIVYMISMIGLASCGGDSAGLIALQKAAFFGQIDALRTLASFGVQDTRGVALVGAILWETDDKCAKFLLRHYEEHALGHINSATDTIGRSALGCAAGRSPKKVQWLLEAGADATALMDLGGIHPTPE